MKGTIKWYNPKKNYGFLEATDGKNYFIHNTQIRKGTKLYEGDQVEFKPTETERGLQAHNVTKKEKEE